MISAVAVSLVLALAPGGFAGAADLPAGGTLAAPLGSREAAGLCEKLPVASVAKVLAAAGVPVEHGSANPATEEVCLYSFSGKGGGATVMMSWTVLPSEQAARTLASRHAKPMPNARALSGIGSEAYVAETPGAVTLFVRRGNAYGQIQLSSLGSAPSSALVQAAQGLAKALVGGVK